MFQYSTMVGKLPDLLRCPIESSMILPSIFSSFSSNIHPKSFQVAIKFPQLSGPPAARDLGRRSTGRAGLGLHRCENSPPAAEMGGWRWPLFVTNVKG